MASDAFIHAGFDVMNTLRRSTPKFKLEVIFCVRGVITPLRSPALARKELTFAIASCLQHCLYETQHPTIGYALGHEREKFRMIGGPERNPSDRRPRTGSPAAG